MKKTSFLASLLLCLAIVGDSRPGSAVSLSPASADQLHRLEKEGWEPVRPGVLQRTLEGDKVPWSQLEVAADCQCTQY